MDFESTIKDIKDKLDKICEVILGDPTDESKPGFIIRLDRLEQSERFKSKILWLLGGGLVAALGQVIFEIL